MNETRKPIMKAASEFSVLRAIAVADVRAVREGWASWRDIDNRHPEERERQSVALANLPIA